MDRRGLPTSSFAPQDEREQLMAAFALMAYERGYGATRLADVADRAGIPVASAQAHWTSEVDCLLETAAASTRRLFARVADVFMGAADDPAFAMHAALGAMLRAMADAPELVHLSVVELSGLGPLVRERQRRMLDLFSDFLGPGFAARGLALPDREIVSLAIGGGIWRIVRRYALQRRLHDLPEALGAISYVCVSTFFGTDAALRVAALPADTR